MNQVKSRKKAISVFAVIAIATAVMASMLVYPTYADEQELQSKNVLARAKGVALQRIDNTTIKISPVSLNLTLTLGENKGDSIPVLRVNGSLNVNGTVYTIEYGDGVIRTGSRFGRVHIAFIRAVGFDAEGNQITLKIQAPYFWWGGNLYAFRAKATIQTADSSMLLLLRGVAKTY